MSLCLRHFPTSAKSHSAVVPQTAGAHAPGARRTNQQACYLTLNCDEDLAAKLKMDPVEVLYKNAT